MTRLTRLLATTLALLAGSAAAKPVAQTVDYRIGDESFRGYAYYDSAKKNLPVVVLIPNWLGNNADNLKQAQEIAGKDYFVFVADMYGLGKLPANTDEAGKAVGALYKDRATLRTRASAAKAEALRFAIANKLSVDTRRVAAIGFCFGGATALEMARSGEPLAAAVSFHGNLSLDAPAENQPITARVLALHGDADPFVPPAQVAAFEDEMRKGNVDWQLVSYGGAVHSFTDPKAAWPGKAEYNPKIARRAFATMRDFLAESFK